MNIAPISLNFINNNQNKKTFPKIQSPKLAPLTEDTFCFTGATAQKKKQKTMDDLVPNHQGLIYKKVKDKTTGRIKKVPQKVDIVKVGSTQFVFDIKGETIGYVRLEYVPADKCVDKITDYDYRDPLYKNYKNLGIVGDRIEVEYLQNEKEKKYGGVGHLADLLEVACCQELGFEPNVISYSLKEAAPIHYLRGKRFVPYPQSCTKSEIEEYNLKGKNPNDTVRKIIKNTPKGKKFNTSELETEPLMYMPKKMIRELEEELKENPIF